MKKLTMLAAAIATMTAMPSFAQINEDSQSVTVGAVVYDMIRIENLENQMFHPEDAINARGKNYTVEDNFRVARRGATLRGGSDFKLTIRQHGARDKAFRLDNIGQGNDPLSMTIKVSDHPFKWTEMANRTPETFTTYRGFAVPGNNMRVRYSIPKDEFLRASEGFYAGRFVYTVAAI